MTAQSISAAACILISKLRALCCADDQTGHLLWRLKNGELPRRHAPRVIVLHAGTTDVKLAHAARGEDGIIDAADGIAARCGLFRWHHG